MIHPGSTISLAEEGIEFEYSCEVEGGCKDGCDD